MERELDIQRDFFQAYFSDMLEKSYAKNEETVRTLALVILYSCGVFPLIRGKGSNPFLTA